MKTIMLKVGDKKSGKEAVKVPLNVAETIEELNQLAKSPTVVIRWATRGQRIEAQERSGAREAFKAGKTVEEIAAIVNGYDPTKTVERTRAPKEPTVIKLDPKKRNYTGEELKALLAAKGIVVEQAAE